MNQKYSRQEILLKGIFLLRRQGYHHTGINDILKECGIPKGSFYNFFKSKEEFGIQCLTLYGRSMLRLIQQFTRDESLSPIERLQSYFEVTIQANEEEGMQYGCLLMNSATELAGYNDRFAALSHQLFELWIEELGLCIEEGQETGEIIDSIPAKSLAAHLYSSFFGAFSRGKMTRSIKPLQQMLALNLDYIQQ